jgi:signal transduction histidine kinase
VYQSSQHLLSLVNDILDVSKIEAGKLELKLTRLPLKPLLEESLSIIGARAAHRGIHLAMNIDQIPVTMTADELRLKQILYNLLSNAVKFTGEGGNIALNVRTTTGNDKQETRGGATVGEALEISVVDDGIGILEEDAERIFEPFSQLETSLSRKYRGTGLGLSITRNLVEMHGGRIWMESGGLGKGTAFRFTLPLS